ncbi:adenylate cyclase type 10-like [Anoplophora glabripennis]|uniref:adenylate cyclase type 10-like n=1 Tax=Anoplophora glabripennis TaxID=217634 RepID=UPI000874CD0A|nr:adenylate cyclase type 10-like [Anoplophora glabripennis]
MMEETDKKSDDPKWEMTNDVIREDDTDWKKRRAVPLLDLKNLMNNGNRSSYFTLYDEGHTRILASLVPDEIIYNIGDYSKRDFDACLLFGDVSGFTDLCEKYNKSGKGGPSRLTQVLNNYIGAMVQEIMSHGGDVLNFSGDAFIALWKVTDQVSMRDAVHEAIDCSLVIQKTYGTYQTDVDVVVRVKLAVASGHLVFSLLGNKESSHYIMTGDPIDAIKDAESKSSAGEIVITARVARHFAANEYLVKVLPDGHIKVLGVGPNWRNIQRQYDDKDGYGKYGRESNDPSVASDISLPSAFSIRVSTGIDEGVAAMSTDQYALRSAVNHAARMRLKDELRRFIIPPVVRGIDASEPLEYLTEIRQVAILFVNCKVSVLVGPVEGIDVADNVYVTVYDIVKDRYGCVNKISNFDKDLMLLIIFGLRGFKHELESQIALRCASECFEKIKNIREINEVAVAVTTGRCYCGAFGHTLRREYTVIGLVVNKAARLMMAYPNRVTCDKETFLYSKLESRNFILQEYKPLKGIVNPGPIYEFKEVERTHDLGFSISPFPLLGREQQLDLYNNLLKRAMDLFRTDTVDQLFNVLIVRGNFRQGKTRLLEEILFTSDPSIPINTFTLTPDDRDISFRTIQLMFHQFIGMPGKTSRSSRERKIAARLQDKNVDEYLFIFNRVFDVRFKVTMNLETDEKILELLSQMFALLCTTCFSAFWIMAIDDADYTDDESWMLIQILIDLRLTFILATMSTQKELTSYTLQVLKNEHIKIVDLKPIDVWYHGGLICQMLGIEGVPPELEKLVQRKSNGNPGWIESFLMTLVQSGAIHTVEIKRINAYNRGIIMPPPYMLMRLSKDEIDLWVNIMEENAFGKRDEDASRRWKIFVDSCRESYPDLTISKTFKDFAKDVVIKTCNLNEDLNLEDVLPEQHLDVVILQTFDSLTSYEQLLLKCSSVLGDMFTRDMLLYIMSSTVNRLTALAVQKLFEIQVLSCAKGNFVEGGLNFKERLIDPNEDLTVKCDCTGLVIEDSCIDLPKYASCGYIRFRSSEFRETTYNLLTDNQKREFHGKAIRYMERETRRCRACGSGYFSRYLGTGRLDDGLRYTTRTKMKKYSVVSQETLDIQAEKLSIGRLSNLSNTKSHINGSKIRDTYLSTSGSTSGTGSLNSNVTNIYEYSGLGFSTVRKLKNNYNLVKSFSSYDYSQCTCLQILSTMYSQLIEHCKGAGLVEKIMAATIEYSYVCIINNNAPQAIRLLEEALKLLDGPMKEQIELEWMVSLKRGKLFSLMGRARMSLEDDEAYDYLMEALHCYGISFPKTHLGKYILKSRLKLRQKIKLYIFSNVVARRRFDEDLAEYCNNVSECLHMLCTYFLGKDKWDEAELAAIWSLNKAIQTESDFEVICLAYASMIRLVTITKQHNFSVALEVFALRTCHRKRTIVELEELKAVSELYLEIGYSRFCRGDMEKSMLMSFPIWRISIAAKNTQLLFQCFNMIAYQTLLKKQIAEFGNMLNEMSYILDQALDNSEKMWYFALCLVIHLETGYIAQPMEKCKQFIQNESLEQHDVRDCSGKMRLTICKWLWEVRNENWEWAYMWEDLIFKFTIKGKGENINNLITALHLLEGLIIYMVNKMDTKNIRASEKADKFFCSLLQKMQKAAVIAPVLQPRLLHLQAYYIMAKYNDYKGAMKYLKKSHKVAEKHHNELEMGWIRHSEMAWSNTLSTEEMFVWQNHSDEENSIHFTDAESSDKVLQYSLPLPLYL